MDLFLTEEDYLPAEFDELPLDEAILRVRELEDERPSKKKKSKGEKVKRKRVDDEDDDPDKQDDEYVEEDGWLIDDLGDDGYTGYKGEEDEDDDGDGNEDRRKGFSEDEAEEVDDVSGKPKKPKNDEKEEKEKKKRRIIRKGPRVILNADRLKHFNALPVLPGILRKMKFKGKGYEEDDLAHIMMTMEQWAHRVMPNMKFDDFIEKVEQLGSKKIIKTFVAKMRYNMTLDVRGNVPGKDFPDTDDEMLFDEELPPVSTVNAEDAFDALMKEAELVVKERAAAAAAAAATSASASNSVSNTTNGNISSTPMSTPVNNSQNIVSSQNTSSQSKPSSLTEEQRRKIAENARKAAEKRRSIAMEKTKKQELEESMTQ